MLQAQQRGTSVLENKLGVSERLGCGKYVGR
jgi:hypothetical protein